MQLIYKLTYQLLIFSLLISQSIFASNNDSIHNKELFLMTIKSFDGSSTKLLDFVKKENPTKYEELRKYLDKEKINSNFKLPSINEHGNQLTFNQDGLSISVEFTDKNLIKVIYHSNSTLIDSSMDLKTIHTNIKELFTTPKTSFFPGLFISNAIAQTLIVGAAILIILIASILSFVALMVVGMSASRQETILSEKLDELAKANDKICEQLNTAQPEEILKEDIIASHNLMATQYLDYCHYDQARINTFRESVCLKIKAAKKCFKDAIEKSKTTNASKRNTLKTIEYNPSQDNFKIVAPR
jgi:hypothetical protein